MEPDYTRLDRPDILSRLFHPRPETADHRTNPISNALMIPVGRDIAVGACFHTAGKKSPTILFFHGNGEIVADYNDLGPLYTKMGINFLPVDYRGYGRSGGNPTVAHMMRDCHAILDYVKTWLLGNGFTGPILVMGRSLGSASAIELGAHRQKELAGIIIESGFAYAAPLLRLLGISLTVGDFPEEKGFGHIDKMNSILSPVLIIHAEYDHIIPFTDGLALFEACHSKNKSFLKIAGADHNDIFSRGLSEYLSAIKVLCKGASITPTD